MGTLANISRRNGRILYPGTISDQRTDAQGKSRNIILDEAQPEDGHGEIYPSRDKSGDYRIGFNQGQ